MHNDSIIRGSYDLSTLLGRRLNAYRILFNAYVTRGDIEPARAVAWDAYTLSRRDGDGVGCQQWLTAHQVLAVLCID